MLVVEDERELSQEIAAAAPVGHRRHRIVENRDQLILEHMAQVKLIAKNIRERLPVSVNLDDLISAGTLGLIAAVDRFDASRGVRLKTYAEYKIRGAILDSLRELDWAPRGQRKHAKSIEHAIGYLEHKLGREPSEEEIAARLGVSLATYREWVSELPGMSLGSLEATDGRDEGRTRLAYVADEEEQWPSRIVERNEMEQWLAKAIDKIPETERMVLNLYFFEHMTLREIGQILKVHDSRISQLKSQGILRLRAHLGKQLASSKDAAPKGRAATVTQGLPAA